MLDICDPTNLSSAQVIVQLEYLPRHLQVLCFQMLCPLRLSSIVCRLRSCPGMRAGWCLLLSSRFTVRLLQCLLWCAVLPRL